MNDTERKNSAWDFALHAEGTRKVFAARARWLKRKTRLRDYLGLSVPILLAYVLGADFYAPFSKYKELATGILNAAIVAQGLIVAWSLLSRWDDERAYCENAQKEAYLLRESWKKIGMGDTKNLTLEYDLIKSRQDLIDVEDSKKGITDREMRKGMRSGLVFFQRKCICGQMPSSYRLPIWPSTRCLVCGGN